MDSNRIVSTTPVVTVPRQTPKNDFGDMVSRGAGEGVRVVSAFAHAAVSGSPIASAAVADASVAASGVTRIGGATVQGTPATRVRSRAFEASADSESMRGGDSWDLLEAQWAMQEDGRSFNAAYLQLQDSLQKESRQFNAVSNIMKVRHDSAKSAINNIR